MYEWNEIAIQIAKEIENEIMPLFGKAKAGEFIGISPSGDQTKLVDKKAENVILNYLKPLNVNIVSEEIGSIDKESGYTVIVDPLDGSYNFINGIPVFGFSFAVFKGEEPVYAMIYEFITRDVYEGIPGEGAYLNGREIHVRPMNERLIALDLYTRGRGIEILTKIKRSRVLGAVAVELAYLAKGAIDGVVDIRNYVRPTDIAAGIVIAKEAGAIIRDGRGEELKFGLNASEKTNLIAVNDERLLNLILESI
ncbi:fructose-1,6-bisphosphatase [Thermococci archaeon]|nr:MAG: fructose-1,6-bisphosphatase [Thermococci archaeon]